MSSAAPLSVVPVGPRETRHAMKLRHKSELKTLMAAAAKGIGAKKKQKEDAAAMELLHDQQMKALIQAETDEKEKEEAAEDAASAAAAADEDDDPQSSSAASPSPAPAAAASSSGAKVPSRAQNKKAAKALKEKNRVVELRELTKDMVDARGLEDAAIVRHIAADASANSQRLRVSEMVSDGHCLYRAVADQVRRHHLAADLPLNDNVTPFIALRQLTAQYINTHRSDFEAFMVIEDEKGNVLDLTEATWKKYLTDLVSDELAVWGGHTEVVALSKALRRPIIIWSQDGRMEVGEEFRASSPAPIPSPSSDASASPPPDAEPLHISFHLHYYGLGSHYNSVVADEVANAEEDFAKEEQQ